MALLVFDLDGVLINSKEAYVHSFCEALEELGVECRREEIERPLGKPIFEVLRSLLSKYPKRVFEAERIVRDIVGSNRVIESIVVCESARNVLERIHASGRFHLCLVTNSDRVFTEKVLKHNSLFDFFDEILTADDKSKSKEEKIRSLLELFNVREETSFFVGDLPSDIHAAKKAGLKGVAVYNNFSWVYPNRGVISKANANFLIEDLWELLPILGID